LLNTVKTLAGLDESYKLKDKSFFFYIGFENDEGMDDHILFKGG